MCFNLENTEGKGVATRRVGAGGLTEVGYAYAE